MWEGWRFVLMEFGAQCVMTFGITGMQQWCVDNWDTQGVSSLSRTYLLVYSTMMYIQGLVSRVIASRMTTMQGLKLGASSVQKVGLVATSIFNAISGFANSLELSVQLQFVGVTRLNMKAYSNITYRKCKHVPRSAYEG